MTTRARIRSITLDAYDAAIACGATFDGYSRGYFGAVEGAHLDDILATEGQVRRAVLLTDMLHELYGALGSPHPAYPRLVEASIALDAVLRRWAVATIIRAPLPRTRRHARSQLARVRGRAALDGSGSA